MADEKIEIRQQAELLTRTGPGTPGGALLRRYWQPVAFAKDLPPGGPPHQIRILSEDLVLFRDDRGRPGLLGLKCAHRCADLSYGRLEDGGLRCVYHGWLYDVDGKCLEQPGEPGGGAHRDQIRQLSYPCVERGGAIWTYMGPGVAPLFPNYPALSAPDDYRYGGRWYSACNYLQGNEGNIDPIHTSYLHRFDLEQVDAYQRISNSVFGVDTAPRLSVENARFGIRLFTERSLPEPGRKILRVTNFVMPNACAIGGYETGLGRGGCSMFWHVPIDDTHHWRYEFTFHSKAKLPVHLIVEQQGSERDENDMPYRNAANRYQQDRDEMSHTFIGMGHNFPSHDLFVTESQGAIHDHGAEHLVISDLGISRARRQLAAAIRDVQDGKDPPGVLRDPADNDFRDLLVLTEPLAADVDPSQFCQELAQGDIYALNPAVAEAKEEAA
jgi:phthalate 4,5-dioxygenase oxygenase subunit